MKLEIKNKSSELEKIKLNIREDLGNYENQTLVETNRSEELGNYQELGIERL